MLVPVSGGQWGVTGHAREVPARLYSLFRLGRQREGPGRENSLASLGASLTNSLSHAARTGPPVREFRSLWVDNVAAFGFSALTAAGVLAW